MSSLRLARALLLCGGVLTFAATPALAQHHHGHDMEQPRFMWGAQAIGAVKHAAPAMLGQDLTEGYLTQPMLMVSANPARWLSFRGVLNLEGLTLRRGELNHGIWGEGYIDRRHPHTYLHEAMLTVRHTLGPVDGSLSAGRGFAPFGTDDPMVRPFLSYPANHHLSQILERLAVIGALRYGPALLEGSVFNGDEPTRPEDLGTIDRVGDSWSVRATLTPLPWLELQGSTAGVKSPEKQSGGGLDQDKQNVSARAERPIGDYGLYALIEHARTADMVGDDEAFISTSTLVEAALTDGPWRVAARYETTTRPEEERTRDLFRTVRPTTDNSIHGRTRWHTWTAALQRASSFGSFRATPFVEVSRSFVEALEQFPVQQPAELYGDDRIWTLSAGVRLQTGMQHMRMGHYGAASN